MSDLSAKQYEVVVTVQVNDRCVGNYNGLRVENRFGVDAPDFMAVAKIISQFYDLAEDIKRRENV
jgi:hypothetical protein